MKLDFGWLRAGLILLGMVILTGCDSLPFLEDEQEQLKASGVVEVVEIAIAPQVSGRISTVSVNEGDPVQAGDELFQMEDTLLDSQLQQAEAAQDTAQSNLETAEASLNLAEAALVSAQTLQDLALVQYKQVLNLARLGDQPNRTGQWNQPQPNEFQTSTWYFDKPDQIAAIEAEVDAAREDLDDVLAEYQELLQTPRYSDLLEAEIRLAQAQAAFLVAQSLLNREVGQTDRERLEDTLQNNFDAAEAELEDAQDALNEILADETEDELLDAKSKLAAAQERYETSLDLWSSTLTGENSLDVLAAQIAIEQSEAAVEQAQAAIIQAEAGVSTAENMVAQAHTTVNMIELQMDELTVYAPESGLILIRTIEPGELIQAGMTAMTLGQMDRLTVTVYVPENRYGQISLGDPAAVTSDSFPDEIYRGFVTRIADRAEYTPSSVQTEGDRSTVVFAIEISVDDPTGKLKPGMPVDVIFE